MIGALGTRPRGTGSLIPLGELIVDCDISGKLHGREFTVHELETPSHDGGNPEEVHW